MTAAWRLFRVELKRLRSRRAIVLMLLGGLLFSALVAFAVIRETRPPSTADLDNAQRQAQLETASLIRDCERNPAKWLGNPDATASDCQEFEINHLDILAYGPLSLDEVRNGPSLGVAALLALLAGVAAASYVGSDWHSGSMTNQLLFRPRRRDVWLAKISAAGLFGLLVTASGLALFWGLITWTSNARDLPTPASFSGDLAVDLARQLSLGVLLAASSAALANLLRSTFATVVTVLLASVAWEITMSLLPVRDVGQFALSSNVGAWLNGSFEIFDPTSDCFSQGPGPCSPYVVEFSQAAAQLGLVAVLVMTVSALVFARSDIK